MAEKSAPKETSKSKKASKGALSPKPSALSSHDPLQAYLAEVRNYPLLSREEEKALATEFYDTRDQKLAQKLVTSNLRFVIKIATEYSKFGAKLIDLIQEGNVGLMHAVREFNPHKDVKLITYAVWWIRGHIQEYLMKQHSMVKIGTTNAQKKLFYKLEKEKQKMLREGLSPDVQLLSSRLGVTEKDVNIMEERLSGSDISLDQPTHGDGTSVVLDKQSDDSHVKIEDEIDLKENLELLSEALVRLKDSLTEREVMLLKKRILSDDPMTLNEIGEELGVTREAIRQSEERLVKKIKKEFKNI